jgi:hypothetical protein
MDSQVPYIKWHGKVGVVVHLCNPSTWVDEAEGLQILGQPVLHSKFKASLVYIARTCLKTIKRHSIWI